jgi:hypothetical protein
MIWIISPELGQKEEAAAFDKLIAEQRTIDPGFENDPAASG